MAQSIAEQLEQLERDFAQRRAALMEPARKRLEEINKQREELDREEAEIREILGEAKGAPRRRNRRSGKRMTAQHKKEIIGRFIQSGHIKSNGELTRELRAALTDEGFGIHDFRRLNDYMPSGWQAKSNGQRGLLAKTTFHQA